ncbi:potassium channel family protein [Neobacillus sp. OS1-32]|uniref:potassium channel family protein n=1 Tax=Neobacillus sp. OS1-32 TaxID=3070682 RepID=UPI0027DEEACC|nr:potassium channel family protein [Neobacillus sp. OS1-32]WML31389.1 potassium channel family protein [Neobacillus sp. OS1-32]
MNHKGRMTVVGMFFKKWLYYLIKLRNIIFFPFVIIYILLAGLGIYLIEPQTFPSFLTAIYWVFTTLATVGFGDYAPVTEAGKAYTIVLYITGIGLLSVFLGRVFKYVYLIDKLKVGGKMKYTGKDHIILIGWSTKSQLAIQEIFKSDIKTDIVIIDDLEKAPMLEERLFYIRGNATDEKTLLDANLPKAKGVIIFADQATQDQFAGKDPLLVDGKTLLIATAITLIEKKFNRDIHITAEVINQQHIPLFEQVKVDEFIPTQEMISHAAVRSLFSHGVTHMYTELMSTQYGDSMYEIEKQAEWRTYRDAFIDLLDKGATLVADGGDMHINQKLDYLIPEDAQLFVICDKQTFEQLNPKAKQS